MHLARGDPIGFQGGLPIGQTLLKHEKIIS